MLPYNVTLLCAAAVPARPIATMANSVFLMFASSVGRGVGPRPLLSPAYWQTVIDRSTYETMFKKLAT